MECTRCGKAVKHTRGEHYYTESGLANVVLLNVEIHVCPGCGQREAIVPQLEELHRLIARAVAGFRPLRFIQSGGWKEASPTSPVTLMRRESEAMEG